MQAHSCFAHEAYQNSRRFPEIWMQCLRKRNLRERCCGQWGWVPWNLLAKAVIFCMGTTHRESKSSLPRNELPGRTGPWTHRQDSPGWSRVGPGTERYSQDSLSNRTTLAVWCRGTQRRSKQQWLSGPRYSDLGQETEKRRVKLSSRARCETGAIKREAREMYGNYRAVALLLCNAE